MEASADSDVRVVQQSGATDTARPAEQVASGDRPPLDNSEFAEHIEMVTTRLADTKERGLDTDRLYTVPPDHKSWIKLRIGLSRRWKSSMTCIATAVTCHAMAWLC
jgi:hypothetical protein